MFGPFFLRNASQKNLLNWTFIQQSRILQGE